MDEVERLEKEAYILAIEELRKESSYFLYAPIKNTQPKRSKREDLINIKDTEIKLPKHENLYIDFDILKDIELVRLKRNGRTFSFPLWEFWQILERIHDCQGYEFW